MVFLKKVRQTSNLHKIYNFIVGNDNLFHLGSYIAPNIYYDFVDLF